MPKGDYLKGKGGPAKFKPGNKLQKLGKPWSIRKELTYLAAQDIDPEKLDEELKRFLRTAGTKNISRSSLARIVAVRFFEKVIKKMDADMVNKLIENIEGKLVQPMDIDNKNINVSAEFDTPEQAMKAFQSLL